MADPGENHLYGHGTQALDLSHEGQRRAEPVDVQEARRHRHNHCLRGQDGASDDGRVRRGGVDYDVIKGLDIRKPAMNVAHRQRHNRER